MGRAALWVMPRLGGDTTSEATAALALCYLSYTVAQVYGGVSGVVAVVFAALEVRNVGISTPLPPGSFFGEMGLIDRQPRSADVYATAYSHLLFLDARDFDELLAADAVIRERIVVEAATRRAALGASSVEDDQTGATGATMD